MKIWCMNLIDNRDAEITDQSADPSVCSNLMEFDICAYRKCCYYYVDPAYIMGSLSRKKLCARRAIEQMHSARRQDAIDATLELYRKFKEE